MRSRPRGKAIARDVRLERSLSPGKEAPWVCDRRRPAASGTSGRNVSQADGRRASPSEEENGVSPFAPAHPCGFPGCPILVDSGHRRCEMHRTQERKEIDQKRGSAAHRGYDARWRAARKCYLANHPLCVECEQLGLLAAASIVDHIVPHKGDPKLFWNESNWQALCTQCHNRKTAVTDGRWG